MTRKQSSREAIADLRERIRTEGAPAAFEALIRVCRDPKATSQSLATAGSMLLKAAGLLERTDDGAEKPLQEMNAEELSVAANQARKVLADLQAGRLADEIGYDDDDSDDDGGEVLG